MEWLKEPRVLNVTILGARKIIKVEHFQCLKLHIRFILHGIKGNTKIMGWKYYSK